MRMTQIPPSRLGSRPAKGSALAAHVKEKAGFFEGVSRLFEEKTASPLGELEELAVEGDTATGHAKVTKVPDVEGGESSLKARRLSVIRDELFKFRRVKGGWLID